MSALKTAAIRQLWILTPGLLLSVAVVPARAFCTVAFLEGPVVLAGLCEGGTVLRGDPRRPEELLVPDNEREWEFWKTRYRTRGQEREISFVPLHEIIDEQYTT